MGVSVEVGPGQPFECVSFGKGRGPCANACQIIRISSCTVISVSQRYYSVVPGVCLGEVVGEVIGLTAGVEEKDGVEVTSQFLAQLLSVFSLVVVDVM